jgi:hypothetical protein
MPVKKDTKSIADPGSSRVASGLKVKTQVKAGPMCAGCHKAAG